MFETIIYETSGKIATITLNRPEKYNTIRPPMPDEIEKAIIKANYDENIRVIILQGAGKSFCAGFDFSENLEHFNEWGLTTAHEEWDPAKDFLVATNPFYGIVPKFMSIWKSSKPVIAKIHGWCVGGGSEMALLADVVIASDDAQFGTPYARVWGCHLTGMWIYRLGLTKAKMFALTGDSVSGKEAADIGLINYSYPAEELDEKVMYWADRMANIPSSQLASMKLIVNQVYEQAGLQNTQYLGPVLDGLMRNTPEGKEFVNVANTQGIAAAIKMRDEPFQDYSQGKKELKPTIK